VHERGGDREEEEGMSETDTEARRVTRERLRAAELYARATDTTYPAPTEVYFGGGFYPVGCRLCDGLPGPCSVCGREAR
jgi:hypothetical protein